MRLEPREYEVVALDHDGYHLARQVVGSCREGRRRAALLLADPEYARQITRVEIRDANANCVADIFPR
jgi:hypothetical protein